MTRDSVRAGVVVALGTSLVVGCGAPAPVEQQTPAQPTATAQASVMSPVSINAEMVAIVDHAGHQLWAVEQEGKAPKTDADWANVTEHATQLTSFTPVPGTLISAPAAASCVACSVTVAQSASVLGALPFCSTAHN